MTGSGLAELRAAAATLAADDPSRVPPVELRARVVELREIIDGLEGLWSRLIRVLDGSGTIGAAAGTGAWLRSACRLSPVEARSRVVLARRLAERPEVDAALATGAISVAHARLVTSALDELGAAAGPELAAATEAPLVTAARRCDPARLRREIAHARHALVPAAAADADARLHSRRQLDVATTIDGVVVVNGVLDPEGGEALLAALAPLSAQSGPDDDRSPGRRRADALVELCRQHLDAGALPALGGERPHLSLLVPLAALSEHRPEAAATVSTCAGCSPYPAFWRTPAPVRPLVWAPAVRRALAVRWAPAVPRAPAVRWAPAVRRSAAFRSTLASPLPSWWVPRRSGVLCSVPKRPAGSPATPRSPASFSTRRASRWTSGGAAGSSRPPSAPLSSSATAAAPSLAATDHRPGPTPTTSTPRRPLGRRRTHQPRQPGPALPPAPPHRPRGTLDPRLRPHRPMDRHPAGTSRTRTTPRRLTTVRSAPAGRRCAKRVITTSLKTSEDH